MDYFPVKDTLVSLVPSTYYSSECKCKCNLCNDPETPRILSSIHPVLVQESNSEIFDENLFCDQLVQKSSIFRKLFYYFDNLSSMLCKKGQKKAGDHK